MTYVEYCRMKCFSKNQTKSPEEIASDASQKQYEKDMKGCANKKGDDYRDCQSEAALNSEETYYQTLKKNAQNKVKKEQPKK